MPVRSDREYRSMSALAPVVPDENTENKYLVRGYATTFDKPYLLYEIDGVKYYECVDRHALDEADMSDVIMQYDHSGRVFARTTNKTIKLTPDDHGLLVDADLSLTNAARDMHGDIAAKLVTKMSWAFRVAKAAYDETTRTRTILKISKVYDVSAVSKPANDDTEISARSFVDGVIEKEKAERLSRRKRILKLIIKTETEE